MNDGPLILVVEDEHAQLDVLAYNLRKAGYQVATAETGDDAETALIENDPDLIVLDWMLPGVSGLELTRRIRARAQTKSTPIVMLTARGEEDDIVRGLDMGVNDYVTKPYSMAELMARIRANLRKTDPTDGIVTIGELTLNSQTHQVFINKVEVHLGPLEFKILRLLLSQPDRVFSRDQLLDRVWGHDKDVGTRTVDVHVGRLRSALGPDVAENIRTVRGVGYSFRNQTSGV